MMHCFLISESNNKILFPGLSRYAVRLIMTLDDSDKNENRSHVQLVGGCTIANNAYVRSYMYGNSIIFN